MTLALLFSVGGLFASPASADFTYASEFGGPGTSPGNIGTARQLAIGPSGTIYVGDSAGNGGHNAIDEYNQQGGFLGAIGPAIPGYPNGSSNCSAVPAGCFLLFYAGVATDSAGNIYVADNGNSRVIKLDSTGQYLATIGTSFTGPSGPDALGRPGGITVQGSDLFVTDTSNARVVEFTTNGTFVRVIGSQATGTPGHGMLTPQLYGVAVDSSGNVYVADAGSSLVQKFNSAGVWLTQWGAQTPACDASSSADGCLGGGNVGPQQLTVDPSGDVFVTDSNHYQIQEFSSDGVFITKFGAQPGCPPVCPTEPQQLQDPAGVATTQIGGSPVVYVSDTDSDYISKWVAAPVTVAPTLPPPVLGKSVDVTPVSGVVFAKPPPGKTLLTVRDDRATAAVSAQGRGFVRLTGPSQLPAGSQVDARGGTLMLTAAAPTAHGKPQIGTFGGALFAVTQARTGASKGLTTLHVLEGAFPGAPTYALCTKRKAADPTAAPALSRTLQLLRASAHGRFSTRGRYSAATVRGTIWTIADRCDGTLIHDITHSVIVNDFAHHKTIIIHAGQSYLAKAGK